jgi:hypothetical protein
MTTFLRHAPLMIHGVLSLGLVYVTLRMIEDFLEG